MPSDPRARGELVDWLSATLNSDAAACPPWSVVAFNGDSASPAKKAFDAVLGTRLKHTKAVLAGRDWKLGQRPSAGSLRRQQG
jgi:hypothetical protein